MNLLQIPLPPNTIIENQGHAAIIAYIAIVALCMILFFYFKAVGTVKKLRKEKDDKTNELLNRVDTTLIDMGKKLTLIHEEERLSCLHLQDEIKINRIHIMHIENFLHQNNGYNKIPWGEPREGA